MIKDKVSFKFKEKGKKAINATGVQQFMISGAGFDVDKIAALFESQGLTHMEWYWHYQTPKS